MKFDVWNDIQSQSSYFKSRPDLMTLGELEGENLKSGFATLGTSR